MTKLRIMSNNVWWCDNNRDTWKEIGADCSADHRAEGLLRIYGETKPDIIGLQECTARMAHKLMTLFAEQKAPYAMLWGRDTPIVYRRDLFELVDSEVLVYPEDIPGLEGSFNNASTKSYCLCLLRVKQTGQMLLVASTHLWYKTDVQQPFSEEARAWQLCTLARRMEELRARYACPAIILGDFNAHPSSRTVDSVLELGFAHAHHIATEHADDTSGMHHCGLDGYNNEIREGGFAKSIDHILVRGDVSVSRYERYCPDYYMPVSDHSPLWIDAEI